MLCVSPACMRARAPLCQTARSGTARSLIASRVFVERWLRGGVRVDSVGYAWPQWCESVSVAASAELPPPGSPWQWSSAGVSTVGVCCTPPLPEYAVALHTPSSQPHRKRSCAPLVISPLHDPRQHGCDVYDVQCSIPRSWCCCDARHTHGTWHALPFVGEIRPACGHGLGS